MSFFSSFDPSQLREQMGGSFKLRIHGGSGNIIGHPGASVMPLPRTILLDWIARDSGRGRHSGHTYMSTWQLKLDFDGQL